MALLAQDNGTLSGRLTAMLERVRARFRAEMRSDLACVNRLVTHAEHYRGKMLRPTLVLAASLAAAPRPDAVAGALPPGRGGSEDTQADAAEVDQPTLVLATVVEMVHMATLVHDDILDEAEIRRGGMTINRLSGNEAAVMLGDYLISHAYHLCSSIGRPAISRAIASATNTVCEGELLQLSNRNRWDLDEATYDQIVRRKTASLCGLCCQLPAMLGDPDPPAGHDGDGGGGGNNGGVGNGKRDEGQGIHRDRAALGRGLYEYGEKLGVAFQIIDDLLDLTGDQVMVGKTLGRDLQKGKLTLPLIRYLQSAAPAQRARMGAMLQAQADPDLPAGQRDDQLRRVHRAIRDSGAIGYARDRAARLVDQARAAAVAAVPQSPARDVLLDMADRVLTRES